MVMAYKRTFKIGKGKPDNKTGSQFHNASLTAYNTQFLSEDRAEEEQFLCERLRMQEQHRKELEQ